MPDVMNKSPIENDGQTGIKTQQERLKEIIDGIDPGIQSLFASDQYAKYLRTMSRFHHYSLNNTILIYMQKPDATLVAGFGKWRDQFKRHVIRGEKSIKIIAPIVGTAMKEREKRDPQTGMIVVDDMGNPVMEKVQVPVTRFKVSPVFDVSQTEGEPIPTLVHDLHGHVEHFDAFYEAVLRSSPVAIDMEPLSQKEQGDGYFNRLENRIVLREGMSEAQTISAAIHEIAHAKLHTLEILRQEQTQNPEGKVKTRSTQEIEAESISYAVCQYYGIETKENSFGYIADWSKGKELPELRASLETINRAANEIITEIDKNLGEIMAERGLEPITMEIDGEQPPFETPDIVQQPETTISVVPDALLMPDNGTVVTMDDLRNYGYAQNDLLPLVKEKAYTLFDQDVPIYAIYENGDAALIVDHAEIAAHQGYFGVDRDDWKLSLDYHDTLARHNSETERLEQEFLTKMPEPCVMIYQHTDKPENREIRFLSIEDLQKAGHTVDRKNYEPIYAATSAAFGENKFANLESVFQQFNVNRPDDFKGHSLSTSDIVALKMNGAVTFHYVSTVGFRQIEGFLPDNPLKNAEMAMEDDYGMIDGIINNGKNPALEQAKEERVAKRPQPLPLREQMKRAMEKHQAQAASTPQMAVKKKKELSL